MLNQKSDDFQTLSMNNVELVKANVWTVVVGALFGAEPFLWRCDHGLSDLISMTTALEPHIVTGWTGDFHFGHIEPLNSGRRPFPQADNGTRVRRSLGRLISVCLPLQTDGCYYLPAAPTGELWMS